MAESILDEDVYYPLYSPHIQRMIYGTGRVTHKLPREMDPHERQRVERRERSNASQERTHG